MIRSKFAFPPDSTVVQQHRSAIHKPSKAQRHFCELMTLVTSNRIDVPFSVSAATFMLCVLGLMCRLVRSR